MPKKIGRNNSCPCGSGKKYKKCCLDKVKNESIAVKTSQQQEQLLQSNSKRSSSSGEKTADGFNLSPYVLAKMLDDPNIMRNTIGLLPPAAKKSRKLWKPSQVAEMTTQEIEKRLCKLGLNPSSEQFHELGKDYTSAWEFSCNLMSRIDGHQKIKSSDEDFIGLAVCELWKRYMPQRPSVEMLDDWMQEGYTLMNNSEAEASDKWWQFWSILYSRITPSMRRIRDADVLISGTQFISNWIYDFSDVLHNASLNNIKYAEIATEFFKQVLEKFSNESEELNIFIHAEMAFMHYRLGRDEEGERMLVGLIERHPEKAAGYVYLSDELSSCPPDEDKPRDLNRAILVLQQAIERPVVDGEDWDLERRLKYLRTKGHS